LTLLLSEKLQLTDSLIMYPNRKLTKHGNVFEGEFYSEVGGVRLAGVKFGRKSTNMIKEAKLHGELGVSTFVVALIVSGIFNDSFQDHVYIAMDRCYHQNMRQYLENLEQFDFILCIKYSKQIVEGMKYIHEKLIIHKDIKPSNILLKPDLSVIKIADFGCSERVKSTSSKVRCENAFGTKGYQAPESFGKSDISLKTDIFSLGALFHFIFSNCESLFGADELKIDLNIKNGVLDFSRLLVPNPNTLKHLLRSMLSAERQRRPSIWQIADHPFWTEKEVECNFGE